MQVTIDGVPYAPAYKLGSWIGLGAIIYRSLCVTRLLSNTIQSR